MNKSLVLLSVLLLAGCATQVPQALSPQMVPKTFTGPIAADAKIWPEPAWWQGFGDAQLTALVTQAQDGNRDIAIAAARVLQAEAQSVIQRSALFPQIGGQTDYQRGGCSGQSCARYPNSKLFGLNFNASYELDFWGLARDNLRAANEQLKAARFAQESVALTVTANVASQYLNVLAIRRRIAIQHQNIDAINAILEVVKLRVKAGSTSHLDLAREQAQLELTQAALPSLETAEKQALYSLAVLLGRPPEGFDVSNADLEKVLPPVVGAGLPTELLLRRPDVAQAEANLASAHANVDAARAAFFPQISLTGQGGFVSTAIGTLLQGSSFGYGYGASLLQTIFDGAKRPGRCDTAGICRRLSECGIERLCRCGVRTDPGRQHRPGGRPSAPVDRGGAGSLPDIRTAIPPGRHRPAECLAGTANLVLRAGPAGADGAGKPAGDDSPV
jgi:multidrug efflux system outer membrane protein